MQVDRKWALSSRFSLARIEHLSYTAISKGEKAQNIKLSMLLKEAELVILLTITILKDLAVLHALLALPLTIIF